MKTSLHTAIHKICLSGIITGLGGLSLGYSQQLAFPGAQGFGQYATGGRGGTVYHVTSLADDGSAGTFRAAVSSPNRIIVFDVGGYINLGSAVSAASNLTIAGQTAPGGGIGLMGNELSFYNQNNIICRHLRVRQGGSSTGSSGINIGSSGGQANNMIFDHTSVEFGQWDSIDAVGTYNFTIQNCIIADPINQQFGAHVQGANASYVNNLWVNAHNRQPLAKASTIYVNNVIYDFQAGYTTADTAGHFSHDIVNNYFITGPSSTAPNDDFFQFDGNQTVYGVGNMLDSSRDGILNGSPSEPGGDVVSATPWSPVTATIPTVSAQNAYRIDVSSAGAFPSDPLDSLVIGQVMSLGMSGNLITSPGNTGLANGGYGTIDGGTALVDSDQDGMPDVWENATGSNPLVADNNVVAADGYTLLEHYLNWLAAPHAFVQTNATDIDLWPYTLGFTNGATYTFANMTNCTVTLTNAHFAHFVPKTNFTGLASFVFAVSNPDGSTMTNTMGLLVSIAYIPKNLVWRGDGVNNIWDTTNTADWFNGNDLVTFNSSDNVTFDNTGSSSPAISINTTVAPGSVVINANQNYTFNGAGLIAGQGAVTITGTNTVALNNINSYTGGTTINNATVLLNNFYSLGTGLVTLNGGTINQSGGSGFGNTVSNLATSTLNFTNGSAIYATLNLIGSGTVNINSGGGGVFTPGGSQSGFTGTVNVNCAMRTSTATTATTFGGANSIWNFGPTGGIYTKNGNQTTTFGALSGVTGSSLSGGGSSPTTYVVGALNTSTTFGGAFNNGAAAIPTSLVKVGTGTLTLSGTSTHTGNTTISNGTILVTGSLSNCPVTVVNGAALCGTGFLGGGVTIQSGGNILPGITNGQAGTLTISNGLTLAAPNLFFDLSSSPSGANDKIVMQGGSLAMSGVNNYIFYPINGFYGAGTYDLIDGATTSTAWSGVTQNLPTNTRQTFNLFRASAGSNPSYVRLTVTGNAGSLVWRGTNGNNWDVVTTNWLNGASADQFYNLDLVQFDDTSTNGNVNIVGTLQPATVLVTNNLLNYTIGGGVLAGFTSLTKNGLGTLTLNSSNSFSGGIFVNGGTLQFVNNYYAGGTGPVTLNGGTLFLNNVGTGSTVSSSGSNTLQTYAQPYAGFNLQGAGILNLNIGSGGVFSPSGDWSGFGGTLNFLTGNWIRELNTVSFGSSNAVWNFGSAGGLYNKYGGSTISLGAVFGGPSAGLGAASNGTTNQNSPTTYVIGGVNTNSIFNGTIYDGNGVGTILIFNGPGSLALTGNNTLSGGTTVNGGTLLVNNTNGSGTGSGSVSINPGGALGGTGTIGGQVSFAAGATLVPGNNGVGTLSITNNLGLNNASILQFDVGTNSDQVAVTGDLTLGGTLNVNAAAGFGPGTYPIFTYGGTLSVGTVTLGTAPASYGYRIDTSVQGQVNLIVSRPQFGSIRAASNGLVMSGSGGPANASYYLLSSTNLALSLANWTRLATNQFDANGNFGFTNSFTNRTPQQFFRLQLP